MASVRHRESPSNALVVFTVLSAVALRLWLFYATSVPDFVEESVEVGTPLTSYKRLKEGVYLWRHGHSPYEGNLVFHTPLLVLVHHFVPSTLSPLLYVGLDIVVALSLIYITRYRNEQLAQETWVADAKNDDSIPREGTNSTLLPSVLYLWNPFTVLTCVGRSSALFSNAALVSSISLACCGKGKCSMVVLAVGTYLGLHPIMILPPLLILASGPPQTTIRQGLSLLGSFLYVLLGILLGSKLLTGSWEFLGAVYGSIIMVNDLSANVGLFWYFFIEVFEDFRGFFLLVFQVLTFIFVVPVTLRFRQDPLFAIYILTAMSAILKSYSSFGDTALSLTLLSLFPELFKYMKYSFLTASMYVYTVCLFPIFFYLWVWMGSGNANFFYAITLVFALAHVITLSDVTFAYIRRRVERSSAWIRTSGVELVQDTK